MILSYKKSLEMIKKYKIPFVKTESCLDFDCLKKSFEKMKKPVVLKISSPDIIHKTDVGAVKTNIKTVDELKKSYLQILSRIGKKYPNSRIEFFLLQEMIKGFELIVGAKIDKTFGKIILVGAGGIFTEVYRDVSIRSIPISKSDTENMIKELKIYKILKGYRGKNYNLDSLKDLIMKTSKMVLKENISELDFNPVILNEKEAKVVDWRIYR